MPVWWTDLYPRAAAEAAPKIGRPKRDRSKNKAARKARRRR